MKSIAFENKMLFSFDEIHGNIEKIEGNDFFIEFTKSIWEIETLKDGSNQLMYIEDMDTFDYAVGQDGIDLAWASSAMNVKVHVCFKGRRTGWDIEAEVKADGTFINKVNFPVFGSIQRLSEADDCLLLPWQNGWIIRDPVNTLLKHDGDIHFAVGRGNRKYENEYPAQYSYQFSAYYSKDDFGYYFATEDSEVYIKTVGYYQEDDGFTYKLINYPENMGQVKNYTMPYTFILEFFKGDWQEAAGIYRKWAVKQKWCKEKLEDKSLAPNLLNTDLWMINHTEYEYGTKTDEYYGTALSMKEKLGCNIALHWYGWNKGQHDIDYPEYISRELKTQKWPEKLKSWNKRFTENDIVKIPYVNARLWDVNTDSWTDENAHNAALKNEKQEIYEEPWKNNNLRPMCPATPLWENKVNDFCREYINALGFDGLYIDQIASYNATLCFDKSHPHPIGGGDWWNTSYHKMMNSLRKAIGEGKILTTESCCETYIDVFDLFLILDTNLFNWGFPEIVGVENCDAVPLFSIIYGDFALSYGSICKFDDSFKMFEFKFIRNMLWGILPTIEGAKHSHTKEDKFKEHMDLLRKAIDFYKENKKIFLYGRLVKIIDIDSDKLRAEYGSKEDKGQKTIPKVIAALWKNEAKEQIYLIYNFGGTQEEIKLDGKSIIIAPGVLYNERLM